MMRTPITAAISTVFLLCSVGAAIAADDPLLGMCIECHGEDGRGTEDDTPIIAGIPAVIQEDALYSYAAGDRHCGLKPMMCKLASRLSEQQVVEFAEHFAAMPYSSAGEDFDAALAEKGSAIHQANCAICHGQDDPGEAESSILHGQRKAYLRYAIQQYASGERMQLPAMEKKTSELSADDIEALINYYASYRD